MKTTTVHLEDITRAARHGVALAFAVSLLGLVVALLAGLSIPIAVLLAVASLVVGIASGGYGVIGRIALPAQPRARRAAKPGRRALGPVRVPQTR